MATDLTPSIAQAAIDPAAAAVDGQSATARPLGDLIKADQYLALCAAIKLRRRGIRATRLRLPAQGAGPRYPSDLFGPSNWS